ncbi:hypothetical protein ACOQFL_21410 [Actinopolyspora sp. H202]|uniref:hypothetical protein n=1 Tax=Actinopolyspora sp. H202 TaxID=1500456 RepID=UPI003EE5CFE1
MSKRLSILISTVAALVLSVGTVSASATPAPQRDSAVPERPVAATLVAETPEVDSMTTKVHKAAPTVWCVDGYYKGIYRGRGCFKNHGDHVTAYDAYADGKHIRTDWYTDYGREGACTDGGDAGGDDCNYNMRENGYLKFQVELRNGSKLVAQSSWDGYHPIGQ